MPTPNSAKLTGSDAKFNYFFTCGQRPIEVDSEDMMTPTANSLSISARKRL